MWKLLHALWLQVLAVCAAPLQSVMFALEALVEAMMAMASWHGAVAVVLLAVLLQIVQNS